MPENGELWANPLLPCFIFHPVSAISRACVEACMDLMCSCMHLTKPESHNQDTEVTKEWQGFLIFLQRIVVYGYIAGCNNLFDNYIFSSDVTECPKEVFILSSKVAPRLKWEVMLHTDVYFGSHFSRAINHQY